MADYQLSKSWDDINSFIERMYDSDVQKNEIYVSQNGSDANIGSSLLPVLTINKALQLSKQGTVIFVSAGDYRETINWENGSKKFSIIGQNDGIVRVMGSIAITGWSKTEGYNNVYQVSGYSKPTWGYDKNLTPARIFEDDTPSEPILSNDRNSHQNGKTHRLNFTEIPTIVENKTKYDAETETLTDRLTYLDNNQGKHYYDSSTNILYVHTSDSENPSAHSYEISVRNNSSARTTRSDIFLENLSFYYASTIGFSIGGGSNLVRLNVHIFGCGSSGFSDSAMNVLSINCEAAGNAIDGFAPNNFHLINFDVSVSHKLMYINNYSHDNKDDGWSSHDRCDALLIGCLFEYNWDNGHAASNCGNNKVIDCLSKKNGLVFSGGAGFSIVNPVRGDNNDRQAGVVDLFNCVSDSNIVGFNATSDGAGVLNCHNCTSRNSSVAEYKSYASNILNAYNCKASNIDPLKLKVPGSGTINVINDVNLT